MSQPNEVFSEKINKYESSIELCAASWLINVNVIIFMWLAIILFYRLGADSIFHMSTMPVERYSQWDSIIYNLLNSWDSAEKCSSLCAGVLIGKDSTWRLTVYWMECTRLYWMNDERERKDERKKKQHHQ